MYTNTGSSSLPHKDEYYLRTNLCPQVYNVPVPDPHNRYVYVKQNFIHPSQVPPRPVIPKVLVNPHFNKKVFVNPNFSMNNVPPATSVPKIHVNPNVQRINLNKHIKESTNVQKIHVNPNILRSISSTLNNTAQPGTCIIKEKMPVAAMQHVRTIISTKNKLIRTPVKTLTVLGGDPKRKTCLSVRSKFKIVSAASVFNSSREIQNIRKRRTSIRSKYKIIKSSSINDSSYPLKPIKNARTTLNKFKLDNRNIKRVFSTSPKNKKYIYVNRFLSISDIARNSLLKKNNKSVINISGVLYKKSPNSLKRTSEPSKKINNYKKCSVMNYQSKYKFIRKSASNSKLTKQNKLKIRPAKVKLVSPRKLKTCNIPCPYYRKFGKCKGKENGRCNKKHDPDQIALCTKFLQGACVDPKCQLSHNVSPEKMPTCKFYLEGTCSKDDCPYLHVRISPKADICKDFLEGFCKKAAECDKRHQFLCPDYEKNGKCLKQRCSYPHGNMVRKYSVFTKNKFAKKSSMNCKKSNEEDINKEGEIPIGKKVPHSSKSEQFIANVNNEINIKARYYVEQNNIQEEKAPGITSNVKNCNNDGDICRRDIGVRTRPKLGILPSFIAFEA